MEHLIELVQARITGGEDFDTIVAECVEIGLCAPEDAEQLRKHFAPSVETAEEPAPPNVTMPIAPPLVAPFCPQDHPARPAPVLQIDWGAEPKPGVPLEPKFTVKGFSHQRPLLYLKIPRIGLKQIPEPSKVGNDWYFYQELRFDEPGQYRCQVVAIDQTPRETDPKYYHADFRIGVIDRTATGQRRKVTIHADGNLTANLDRFGKDADIEIVGGNVALMARDEAVVDKLIAADRKAEAENIPDSTTTIPFQPEPEIAKRIPYISQPDAPRMVSRLTMTESEAKRYTLIGGRHLYFGRDVPEQNIKNDVPLGIFPGTQEEKNHIDEFSILNALFSREHASLEVHQEGVYLVDRRRGGIQDATYIGNTPLARGKGKLMFSHDDESALPQSALFSKMLSMTFTPHYGKLYEDTLRRQLPEEFPSELLDGLYSLVSSKGLSSVCVTRDRHYKQKDHAEALLKFLRQHAPQIAEVAWWERWFTKKNNEDPLFGTHEYWIVPLFVTLGRDHRSDIKLENRQWNDVRLRILFINNSLYVENVSLDTNVKFGVGEDCYSLLPFRPHPLCSGAFVRKGDATLRFE